MKRVISIIAGILVILGVIFFGDMWYSIQIDPYGLHPFSIIVNMWGGIAFSSASTATLGEGQVLGGFVVIIGGLLLFAPKKRSNFMGGVIVAINCGLYLTLVLTQIPRVGSEAGFLFPNPLPNFLGGNTVIEGGIQIVYGLGTGFYLSLAGGILGLLGNRGMENEPIIAEDPSKNFRRVMGFWVFWTYVLTASAIILLVLIVDPFSIGAGILWGLNFYCWELILSITVTNWVNLKTGAKFATYETKNLEKFTKKAWFIIPLNIGLGVVFSVIVARGAVTTVFGYGMLALTPSALFALFIAIYFNVDNAGKKSNAPKLKNKNQVLPPDKDSKLVTKCPHCGEGVTIAMYKCPKCGESLL